MSIKRKRLLPAVALSAAALLLAACGDSGGSAAPPGPGVFEGRGPITYVAGKDVTGTVRGQIDRWNRAHPEEKVTFIELPEAADAQRQQMIQNAQTKSDAYTVLSVDVVWTAEFAANRWIDQLPAEQFSLERNLAPTVQTGMYRDRLFTVPTSSDGGLLYYRTDLLAKAGIARPPASWEEVTAACKKVLVLPQARGMSCFAGQYEKYEGLTVNVAEAVNAAGGAITDGAGRPTVDSPQARRGLDALVHGFRSGAIPDKAITFKEEEGRRAFQAGELVFHRQWPYQYALANQTDGSSKVAGKFAVAPLPGIAGGAGSSSLGGHNLAISSSAENKATALDFIKYFSSPQNQRASLVAAAVAPTHAALYDDPALVKQFPYLPALKQSILTATPRPVVVPYGDASAAIQDCAYAALTGAKTSQQALSDLQARLEELTS